MMAAQALTPLGHLAVKRLLRMWAHRGNPWTSEDERERLAQVLRLHDECFHPEHPPPELKLTDRSQAGDMEAGSDTRRYDFEPVAHNHQSLQAILEDGRWAEYEDPDVSTVKSLLCELDDTPPGALRQVVLELHWWLLVQLPKILRFHGPGWEENIQARITYLKRLRGMELDPALRKMFPGKDATKRVVWVFQEMERHLQQAISRKAEEIAHKQSAELLGDVCRRTKTALCEVLRGCALVLNDTDMKAIPTFQHLTCCLLAAKSRESFLPWRRTVKHSSSKKYSPLCAAMRMSGWRCIWSRSSKILTTLNAPARLAGNSCQHMMPVISTQISTR
eukprot:COSAG01_NODE_17086_length_1180_cov_0.920444_2_plen_334_part_00